MTESDTPVQVEPTIKAGNSQIQRDAETLILRRLSEKLGLSELRPGKVVLADGVKVEVDGVDHDRTVFVEAFARQGPLKGGQIKKVAQDILKLSLIKAHLSDARLIIVFASHEARHSIRGWLGHAAEEHEIELRVVDLGPEANAEILAAQKRQFR